MPIFHPKFWEFAVGERAWAAFACENALHFQTEEAAEQRREKRRRAQELAPRERSLSRFI